MNDFLRTFLGAHPAHYEGRDDWPLEPSVPLRVRLCLTGSLPPATFRSSVLGIVTHAGRSVLFLNPADPSGTIAHVLIGGRPQRDETPEETLQREVAEETGWLVKPTAVIGFRHFRHIGSPHPEMEDRPYPDFLQPVYAAIAMSRDARLQHEGEIQCGLVDAGWALEVTEPAQRPLLRAALEATGMTPARARR